MHLDVGNEMGIQLSHDYDTPKMRIGPTLLIGLVLFIASSYFLTFKSEPEKWPIGLLFTIPILLVLRFVKKKNLKNYRNLVMENNHLLIQEQHSNRKIQYSDIYSVTCNPRSLYGIATILLMTGEELRFSVNQTEKDHFMFREPAVITELRKRINSNHSLDSIVTSCAGPDRVN